MLRPGRVAKSADGDDKENGISIASSTNKRGQGCGDMEGAAKNGVKRWLWRGLDEQPCARVCSMLGAVDRLENDDIDAS